MAEAVAAFGLAGNVLQFLDFGSKLAVRFREYYRSSRDGHDVVPNAQLLTNDLRQILKQLEEEAGVQGARHMPFRGLAIECSKVAEGLLRTLKSLGNARDGRLSALKTAFKSIWKEEDIARLQLRLDQFRTQLILQLVSASREQIRTSENHQVLLMREIQTQIDQIHGKMQTQLQNSESLGSRIVDMVVLRLASTDRATQKDALEDALIKNLLHENDEASHVGAALPILSSARHEQISARILSELHYTDMSGREDNIANAHAATFRWIFDNSGKHIGKWSSLPEWLASDLRIYWVTGKAGSGKSTLMKYICQALDSQSQTSTQHGPGTRSDDYFRAWAPHPLRLVRATFFFWSSGAEVQMSQSGLLRSLLHQILSQMPSLLPTIFPRKWEAMCLYGLDSVEDWEWTEKDLTHMMSAVVTNMDQDMRLCLFVDGLDEFNGDHLILVQLLKDMSNDPRVKVCVSSRPWDIFETKFEQTPSLRMEMLTHDDIKAYTSARLLSDPDFLQLRTHETQHADSLVENIVKKAAGVFLWVKLVVSSLLSGIRDGDRIEDLQNRLKKLPPDLERLYDNMLDNIDRDNVEHTAQLFTIVATSFEPMNVILLSFIDQESYMSALSRPFQALTSEERKYRFERMRRRLSSRTMGLLELNRATTSATPDSALTVQYLHKTVYDYIQSPSVKERLSNALKSSFDVHMRMCIGILAYMKSEGGTHYAVAYSTNPWLNIAQFMYSASKVRPKNYTRMLQIIDGLNETGSKIWASSPWVKNHPAFKMGRSCNHFISLAIRYGITYYVESRSTKPCTAIGSSGPGSVYPLLTDTVSFRSAFTDSTRETIKNWHFMRPNFTMAETLVHLGAQFQVIPSSEAVLYDPAVVLAENLLSRSGKKVRRNELLKWQQIVQLFIEKHDEIWSTAIFHSWDRDTKSTYHEKLQRQADRLNPEHNSTYSIMHWLRVLMSLRDSKRNIHKARLEMLINLDRQIRNCTKDESQDRVVWLPEEGLPRIFLMFQRPESKREDSDHE